MSKRELKRHLSEAINNQAVGKTLGDIATILDRERFMLALEDYVAPPGVLVGPWEILLPLDTEPRTALVLDCLTSALSSSGSAKFLIESRVLFEEALAACIRVRATRATEYLRHICDLFPGKFLPPTGEACADLILSQPNDIERGLRQLDQQYLGVYEEIVDSLRVFVSENIDANWAVQTRLGTKET